MIENVIAWAAPILSTLVVCAGQLALNAKFREAEEKRDRAKADTDAKRAAEAEWRESVDRRMEDQERKIHAMLKGQTTQMRSDLIHRAHRYIDDLGKASIDEKKAFDEEYKDYCDICKEYKIKNSFIDKLAERVMELPERDV